jgi:outer membrane protein assembly factor BamB
MGGYLYKLDRDGNEQWSLTEGSSGIAGNPVVDGDTVYFGAFDKNFYAVSSSDGSMRWSFGGDNWFWGTPIVDNGMVYAPNLDGRVYAIRDENGQRAWDFDAGAPVRSGPALVDNALVIAARDGDVSKVSLESGELMGGSLIVESKIESNLTADDDGRVFVVPHDATLYIIDASGDLTAARFPLE